MLYRNPQTEQWETDDQYLSGDVRAKLENARAAAAADPSYQENVTALEAVQPADLTASEIDARLGAVVDSGRRTLRLSPESLLGAEGVTVSHAAAVGTWFSEGDYGARGHRREYDRMGHGRYSALELIQDALNLKTPTVYDTRPADEEQRHQRARKPKPRATRWRRSRSASKRGCGRTTSGANGSAANTTTSSTPCGCASSTAAI